MYLGCQGGNCPGLSPVTNSSKCGENLEKPKPNKIGRSRKKSKAIKDKKKRKITFRLRDTPPIAPAAVKKPPPVSLSSSTTFIGNAAKFSLSWL
jgi:hypothetical protein